ncbi:MAG: polymer-forming cytoskeletal protein [Planctomycetota bacterium]|nr:polymer-forming cytoskeletal protein [Planctomycetota bacterium]
MRLFAAGLALGALLGVGGMILFGSQEAGNGTPPASIEAAVADRPEPTEVPAEPPMLLAKEDATPATTAAEGAPFPAGEAVLRIGDAYVLGEDGVRPFADDDAEEAVDVVCQDIRYGTVLRTPHGAVRVPMPFTVGKDELSAAQVYALLADAPEDLPDRNASLTTRATSANTGIALIQSSGGRVFKVRVVELQGDPRAWKRSVRIAYAEVPVVKDGGRVLIEGQPRTAPASVAAKALLEAVKNAPRIPGDSFRSFLTGSYESLTELPEELTFQRRSYVALPEPLTTQITTTRYSGVLAEKGIARDGKLTIKSYTGVGVEGDMDGTIDVQSYAYLHIRGDVTGTINCGSYATVVIDGDVHGTIQVGSYVTLYLKGRLQDPPKNISAKGSCWSTFYFSEYHDRSVLESVPATKQITLHVRDSDLPVGKHKDVKPWREVIVGDKLWERL